jgi:hypothetical protein
MINAMATTLFGTTGTTQPGAIAPPAVAKGDASSENGAPRNSATTAERVVEFGGNKGGRPRADNLVPGSPEAQEADRKKETLRKAEYRAKLRAKNPPALPPALPSVGSQGSSTLNAPQALPGNQSAGIGAPPVAWQPDSLQPIIDQILPIIEQERVRSKTTKAVKAALPAPLLKEIEKDSHFPASAKVTLSTSVPRMCAKWLNKFGLSAEYQDETLTVLAILSIYHNDSRIDSKLDKLIKLKEQELSAIQQQQKQQEIKP